jgi:DNA-binding protein H-NS
MGLGARKILISLLFFSFSSLNFNLPKTQKASKHLISLILNLCENTTQEKKKEEKTDKKKLRKMVKRLIRFYKNSIKKEEKTLEKSLIGKWEKGKRKTKTKKGVFPVIPVFTPFIPLI